MIYDIELGVFPPGYPCAIYDGNGDAVECVVMLDTVSGGVIRWARDAAGRFIAEGLAVLRVLEVRPLPFRFVPLSFSDSDTPIIVEG